MSQKRSGDHNARHACCVLARQLFFADRAVCIGVFLAVCGFGGDAKMAALAGGDAGFGIPDGDDVSLAGCLYRFFSRMILTAVPACGERPSFGALYAH